MGSCITQQAVDELDKQYRESRFVLEDLEQRLILALDDLGFTGTDKVFAIDYVQDHVTLFRFLKDAEFDREYAYQRIVDAVVWRRDKQFEKLCWSTLHPSFYENEHAFAYFRHQDRFGRPMALIRMRYFPSFGDLALADTLPPFACLVMEIARRWTRDLTNKQGKLVSQISVVIDIAKAPMVPPETRLIQEMRILTDDLFPGFFGSIYIMNFGWMYQGIWQMVKLMLTERAKSKVNFPSLDEVKTYIDLDNLPDFLGGNDTFEWSLEGDGILQQYGRAWIDDHAVRGIDEDHVTVTRSRRSESVLSLYSSGDEDEFFDVPDIPSSRIRSGSVYATPGGARSPYLPLVPAVNAAGAAQHVPYFQLTGFHVPSFLSSFFGTSVAANDAFQGQHDLRTSQQQWQQQQDALNNLELSYRLTNLALEQQLSEQLPLPAPSSSSTALTHHRREPHFPHLLPAGDPHSLYANAPLKMQLRRSEQRIVRLTRRLFRLSFAYHGTFYWVLLYLFLRGPVEQSMRKMLAKMMVNPRSITYTTVGITASVAAGLSASLSSSLGS
ncbi:hypothetical protein BC940DRAFT_334902 [Gongronella butleri]|nr:hypothetical protein BC940DRAFT_334902 [Gongronella butleri]